MEGLKLALKYEAMGKIHAKPSVVKCFITVFAGFSSIPTGADSLPPYSYIATIAGSLLKPVPNLHEERTCPKAIPWLYCQFK